MQKLVITARQMTSIESLVEEKISALGAQLVWSFPEDQHFSSTQMIELAQGATVVIAGDDVMDEAFFADCQDIRRIVRWGVGMDSVDHAAAEKQGVEVVNTPGILGRSVAEYAVGFIFLLSRHQHLVDAGVREGSWPKPRGKTVIGKTLGIVGYGDIGRQIGGLGKALGLDIVWFDPLTKPHPDLAGESLALDDIVRQADFLVLSCPLTESTRNLANASLFGRMKPSSYLVNVSRGEVVNEKDLITALEKKWIAGAALDVFNMEPLPEGNALLSMKNVILGSHNASNTEEGVRAVSEEALRLAVETLGNPDLLAGQD